MHIIKFDAGHEFYATAWCGEKVGMLDRAYMSIDNALKAIEHNVGVICPLCLSVVIETANNRSPADVAKVFESRGNMSIIEEIAKRCHTRIAANDGFFHEEYFVGCIVDAIKEAIAIQQSAHPTLLESGQIEKSVCTCAQYQPE